MMQNRRIETIWHSVRLWVETTPFAVFLCDGMGSSSPSVTARIHFHGSFCLLTTRQACVCKSIDGTLSFHCVCCTVGTLLAQNMTVRRHATCRRCTQSGEHTHFRHISKIHGLSANTFNCIRSIFPYTVDHQRKKQKSTSSNVAEKNTS